MFDYLYVFSLLLKIFFIMCIKIMVLNKLYYGMIVVDMFRLVRSKNMSKFWFKICLFKINFIMSDLIR